MKKGIIGAGGFGREVYWSLSPIERINTVFFVDDDYWKSTEGNAKRSLIQLLTLAKLRPDGIWDGD